jgi:RimJ/RimL family protein N-acetyltransferase
MEINWKTDRVTDILPEEFYALIDRNREHISKTFPVTLAGCADIEKTIDSLVRAKENEQNKENYYFYLRNTDSNALIGFVCIKNIDPKISKCELAYFVDAAFEGKGIITKAVGETIVFCFDELKMNKVFICTSKVNLASQKIATKHGFVQEGTLREEFRNGKGILEDIVYWGLLKLQYKK